VKQLLVKNKIEIKIKFRHENKMAAQIKPKIIFRDCTTKIHHSPVWSQVEVKNCCDPKEFATKVVEKLNENGVKCSLLTQGFRVEFDGIPVICRQTRRIHEAIPGYSQRCYIVEYAVINRKDEKMLLFDYQGPSGSRWSGNARDRLEQVFLSMSM